MLASVIIEKLLEDEGEMSSDAAKRYIMGLDIDPGVTPEQFSAFKSQAIGYIKWVTGDEYDEHIEDDIEAARTFDQVAEILNLYDESQSDISFLSMINQGYF